MKKCPYCAEHIQDEAIVCRYCGRDLRSMSDKIAKPVSAVKSGFRKLLSFAVAIVLVGIGILWFVRELFPANSLLDWYAIVTGQPYVDYSNSDLGITFKRPIDLFPGAANKWTQSDEDIIGYSVSFTGVSKYSIDIWVASSPQWLANPDWYPPTNGQMFMMVSNNLSTMESMEYEVSDEVENAVGDTFDGTEVSGFPTLSYRVTTINSRFSTPFYIHGSAIVTPTRYIGILVQGQISNPGEAQATQEGVDEMWKELTTNMVISK